MQPPVLLALLLTAACGSAVPLVGSKKKPGAATAPAPAPSANALPDKDHNPDFLASIDTPDVESCHQAGFVYLRRMNACSPLLKIAKSYTCERAGIRAAFSETGFQVDEALDQAMGKQADPNDHGAGFVLDQCGEADDGDRYVQMVKKDAQNQLVVRELETQR